MLLFYIRHGDPIYSPDSLTPLGKRQADAIAKRLALYGIDEIYSSTSERAYLTAVPTSELLKKDITKLDFCNEKYAWDDFTVDFDGSKEWVFFVPELRETFCSPEVTKFGDMWYDYPEFSQYKFKSGIERINREVDNFFKTLGYEHQRDKKIYIEKEPNNKRIALFAHQGFGICFLSSVLDIPYPLFATHFDICHTGMTVIDFTSYDGIVVPKVLTVSNDSHLYREGLPTKYNNCLYF